MQGRIFSLMAVAYGFCITGGPIPLRICRQQYWRKMAFYRGSTHPISLFSIKSLHFR